MFSDFSHMLPYNSEHIIEGIYNLINSSGLTTNVCHARKIILTSSYGEGVIRTKIEEFVRMFFVKDSWNINNKLVFQQMNCQASQRTLKRAVDPKIQLFNEKNALTNTWTLNYDDYDGLMVQYWGIIPNLSCSS